MGFWTDSQVLITGGHGFTGSHLCRELLREGARVKALVKKDSSTENLQDIENRITIVRGSITDFDGLTKALEGVDYVFHPAAVVPVVEARKSPQDAFLVNGIGAFNVAYAAQKSGVKKMLHISTCHVYGNLPQTELPIRETASPQPGDLYAASKYAAEIYLRALIQEGFPIVISRAFAKYGPGQGTHFFIPRVISQLLRGETPNLGNPKPTRDYSYITDIVRGYMTILEKGTPGEIYHLSSQTETSVGEICELILELTQAQVQPNWNQESRPQDIMRLYGDSTKVRNQFGWKPTISLKEGLARTIDWWKKRL